MVKHNKVGRKPKPLKEQEHEKVERLENAYKFVERRQVTVNNVEDLPKLGSIYSAQMLKYSEKSDPQFDIDDYDIDDDRPNRLLKLPHDGSIFHDGIPFHHFALTNLKEKHVKRLKKNGIEIKQGKFSIAEDNVLRKNWESFAAKHKLRDEEVPEYMGAAAATESKDERRQRIRFIHKTLFRPWMCSKLLDRNAIQVFRRCYHLFHVSRLQMEDLREWTEEDDQKLLQLVEEHGRKWEFIGNELLHTRISCYKRFKKLIVDDDADDDEEWTRIEIARLYDYLCDHLPRNPTIIALISKYENLDSHINWSDARMRLPRRNAQERKMKWQELKQELRATRERIQSDSVKEILREVIPEDAQLLARAKIVAIKRNRKMKCPEMAKYMSKLREFCASNGVEKARDINVGMVEEMFNSTDQSDTSALLAAHFVRVAKYILFLGHRIGLFKILPIKHDTLPVRLEMFAFILNKIEKFKVKKKEMRKLARKFVRSKGWDQRDSVVFVQRRPREMKEYEETPNKLIRLLLKKK